MSESQKENWKNIHLIVWASYPWSTESQKENWKHFRYRPARSGRYLRRISKRELKGRVFSPVDVKPGSTVESQKENWKYVCIASITLHLTKESQKENWKRDTGARSRDVREKPESQKENWKSLMPSCCNASSGFMWISKRELKGLASSTPLEPLDQLRESQKENWKLLKSMSYSYVSASRISKRELKVIVLRRTSCPAFTSESQKENWKSACWRSCGACIICMNLKKRIESQKLADSRFSASSPWNLKKRIESTWRWHSLSPLVWSWISKRELKERPPALWIHRMKVANLKKRIERIQPARKAWGFEGSKRISKRELKDVDLAAVLWPGL